VVPPLGALKSSLSLCFGSYDSAVPLSDSDSIANQKIGDHLSVKSENSPLGNLPIPNSPLNGAIRYFNEYGFTYVGIYREDFMTSSRKATEVFQAREWLGVVSDNLISNVLSMIIVIITFASGGFGLIVEEFDGYNFSTLRKPSSTAFVIGCCIGLLISSVCLKVVASSVNTVLVCFSLAPWRFHINHPDLSKDMRASWGGFWLDEYDWLADPEREEVMLC